MRCFAAWCNLKPDMRNDNKTIYETTYCQKVYVPVIQTFFRQFELTTFGPYKLNNWGREKSSYSTGMFPASNPQKLPIVKSKAASYKIGIRCCAQARNDWAARREKQDSLIIKSEDFINLLFFSRLILTILLFKILKRQFRLGGRNRLLQKTPKLFFRE